MSQLDLILIITTSISLICFCVIFTLIFRHHYLSGIEDCEAGKFDIELIDESIKDEKRKKSKSHKIFKIVTNVLSYTLIALLGVSFIFSLIGKVAGEAIPFGNNGLIAVSTGSMSEKNSKNSYLIQNNLNDQIQTFDLIGINKVKNKDELKLYDIICFKAKNGDNIIHRIIEITDQGYITQGDANAYSDVGTLYDSYLSFNKVLGKYNGFKIPVVGMFVVFLQSISGMLTIASLIYCLFMFDHYKSKYNLALMSRSDMLIQLIEDEIKKEEGISSSFKETLVYKGIEYHFENGEFVSKNEVVSSNLESDEMLLISKKGEKEVKTKKNIKHS